MIRSEAATACAKTILAPFIKIGYAKPDMVPLVAMMIQMSVKEDELDQQIEAGEVTIPERD